MKKLTQTMIDEAQPQDKEYYLFDVQYKGLGCRILPTGNKTYYYRYTSPVDKIRKKIKLEDANIISLEDARSKARKFAEDIYNKIDPQQTIKKKITDQQKSTTFEEFWPIFEKEYILEELKESTRNTNKSKFKLILNFFGKMEINKIEYRDVINFRDSINKKHNSVFPIVLSYLRMAFMHSEFHKLRAEHSNPCKNVKGWDSDRRERFLTEEELSKIVNYMEYKIKNGNKSPYPYYALLCLIYTGQRKSEILELKWEDIDFKQKIAILHDSKTGKREFVLNDKALEVLNQIPKQEDNPYVFCGPVCNSFYKNIDKIWDIIRNKFDIEDVRIHDLRHSFASFAINNGVSLYDVSKLLGHKSIATTQRYAHLSKDTQLKAANEVFK